MSESTDGGGQFHRKLGVRLIALVLVCSLVPLGVTTATSVGTAQDALEQASTERQASEAEAVARNAEARSEFYRKQVQVIREHPAVRNVVRYRHENPSMGETAGQFEKGAAYPAMLATNDAYGQSQQFFEQVAEKNPNIDMIRVFWKDGNVLTGYKFGTADTRDFKKDKAWFEAVMDENRVGNDEIYVSAINIARATDSPAIRYAMPIHVDGERVGLVIINYKAEQITAPVTDIELGDSGYGMLVNPNYTNAEGEDIGAGYVANGRDPSLAFNTSVVGNLSFDAGTLSGTSGEFTFTRDGRQWHAQYERLDLGGKTYYAVVAVPMTEMLAASHSIRDTSLLVGGVSGVLVLLVGAVVSRRITGPIRRLAADAEAVAGGDMDREVRTSDVSSEISRLTRAARGMKENVVDALDDAERQRREAERFTDHLEATADEYETVMNQCADGDLTGRMEPDGESEAMAAIAESFNEMVADWERTVGDIQSFAEDVAASSQQVTASTDEVQEASEEVSRSVQEIADGANDQSASLDEIADEMNHLSATIEEIASSAETVAERSQDTEAIGEDGRETAQRAIDRMREVRETARRTAEGVRALDEQMDAIGEITGVIADIAEQTNLLALNANIEAARADGDGEGFAVVADEVKTLADETKESAEEIESIVADVQERSAETVEDVVETEERIEDGVETVEETVEALEAVTENVAETNAGVQEIHDATGTQADSTQEVVSMAEDVAAISEETTSESESVAGAAQQQTAALDEVSRTAGALSERADELAELLEEFDTDAEATPRADASTPAVDGTAGPVATDGGN
jgi:methyl-accepting chemotaxis protein